MPIDPATGAVIVAPSTSVSTVSRPDMVLSPDGLTLYASGPDGKVRVFNAETGELIKAIAVGINLGAIDVSPDGRFLMVVETKELSISGDQWDAKTNITAYRVDLATDVVKSFPFTATGYDRTFSDVAVLSDGKVLFTQNFGGSGWTDLKLLDPATGEYEPGSSVRHASFLSRTADGSKVLIAEADISSAPLNIYLAGEGIVGTQDAFNGFNDGFHAISDDGALVAQHIYGEGIYIFDGELDYQLSLGGAHPEWRLSAVGGLAFASEGRYLFVLDVEADAIVQLSTSDWSVVQTVPIGFDAIERDFAYGNNLLVGPNLRFFTISTSNGVHRIDNPAVADALAGTESADAITGTAAGDTLVGYGGDDQLAGGGGADTMIGGDGNDGYSVGAGDRVVEKAGGGYDTVRTSVTHRLADNVEKLVLAGSAGIGGTGNAGANALFGNAAGNKLDGGAGADVMTGRGGSDTYVVDNSGDRVVELAGEGTDTVQSKINHSLAANVERLLLTGTAARGTGNGLDNILTGNSAANILDGRGGADEMFGRKGNDIFFVDNSGDEVVELSGEGLDTVNSKLDYVLGSHVENLTLLNGAADGSGNGLDNRITGNGGGNRLEGGGGKDVLSGAGGADELRGGSGRDSLNGGSGDDELYGGLGNDRLVGGGDSDGFYFDTAPNRLTNCDTIVGFSSAADTIFLSRAVFSALPVGELAAGAFAAGTAAQDSDDRIVYDQAAGKIFYDPDGSGAAAAVLFARVEPGIELAAADFMVFG